MGLVDLEKPSIALGTHGLPKLRKANVPLPPNAYFTTSPLRVLTICLHRTVAPLVSGTAAHIRDLSHFEERMQEVTVNSDECIASFDVVSGFTSVP